MTYHEENKVNNLTFEFTYNELFLIYKKLYSESSKLIKNIVYVFKSTIYSLEKENKSMLEEIDCLREK